MNRLWGAWCVALVVSLAACDRSDRSVVVYVSADEAVATPILDRFEETTGIRVLMVGDTEARKTTGLLDRIRREAGHPMADVLWSSEAIGTVALAENGLLAPHRSLQADAWPDQWKAVDRTWYAFSPRPRVLVFDPAVVDPQSLPTSWAALSDPVWRGRIAMADPRFGTTRGHLAAIRWWMGGRDADAWPAWLEAMRSQDLKVLPGGNAAVVDAVDRGEATLGMTDADDVHAANRLGAALEMRVLRHGAGEGEGAMLMPNTAAIVQGAPHPGEAAALVDWLLSEETATMLADSYSRNVPLQPRVAARFPELGVDDPLRLDLGAIQSGESAAMAEVTEVWLGAPSSEPPAR